MKLLEAEPQVAPDGDAPVPETPTDAVPTAEETVLPGDGLLDPVAEDVPVETGPSCRACGSAIDDGQDWCLACGTAVEAPRRLPGVRALGIAGVLTLALTGGAVAAAAAAFKHEPPAQQTKVETVAQTTPAPTTDTTPTDVAPLPPVSTDDTAIPPADVTPITPDTSSVTPIAPVVTTPTTTPTTTTPTTTTPAEPKSARIVLSAGAGSLYDPGARATATGDPDRAIDGNTGTSWFATVPAGSDMNVGYLIDLGEKTRLSKIELLTKTPGFTVQVFGSTGSKAPETADDPKWAKLGEAGSVDGDPAEGAAPSVPPVTGDKAGDGKLVLPLKGAGADGEYRQVLLWFTTPPAAGPTVRLSEIKLYD